MILAEGCAAETYLDATERDRFDNYDEYIELYGKDRLIQEAQYPRLSASRLLPARLGAETDMPARTG